MIWYTLHNILKTLFPNMEQQHRHLTSFLIGVILYTLFYSYVGTLGREHTFLNVFFKYSVYILISDAFAMAILYKNFYKRTIFKEVEETIGTSGPKQTATNVEPIMSAEACVKNDEHLDNISSSTKKNKDKKIKNKNKENIEKQPFPEISNEINDDDSMEGFAKDTALGDVFNTSGLNNY